MKPLLALLLLTAALGGAAAGAAQLQAAVATAGPPPKGTVAELWSWWPASRASPPPGATPALACLGDALSGAPRDKTVFSQAGEDGILEAILDCIGPGEGRGARYYAEFGTQDCSECTTRYLRTKGWTGLLMDGGYSNASINLQQEFMRSDNIAALFKKHGVPHPHFDHLTVDVDLNTFWLLRAVLAAGYWPRSVAVEYNRQPPGGGPGNFAPNQSYAVVDMPGEMWAGGCYYGASGLALERLVRAFDYSLVAFDQARRRPARPPENSGFNLFFVRSDLLGVPLPHSFAGITPNPGLDAWRAVHPPCQQMVWLEVGEGPDLASSHWLRRADPAVLGHRDDANLGVRTMYEVETPAALGAHRALRRGRHDKKSMGADAGGGLWSRLTRGSQGDAGSGGGGGGGAR
ncbi:MAG: hypothetical protein J3K34DRAFT_487847 [Monoraphidium minutum]|nr:MAG: hypothetical protein J3K34DRAFT_487847 [Monoraphidium minutum]